MSRVRPHAFFLPHHSHQETTDGKELRKAELREEAVPLEGKIQKFFQKYFEDTCTDPSCDCRRPPEDHTTKEGCSHGDNCANCMQRGVTSQTRNHRRMDRQEKAENERDRPRSSSLASRSPRGSGGEDTSRGRKPREQAHQETCTNPSLDTWHHPQCHMYKKRNNWVFPMRRKVTPA